MADPATITMAVKAAVAVATDKRTWKVIGVIIAAILTPFILIIVCIMSLLSGTSSHNNNAVDLVFNGGNLTSQTPPEYQQYISDMQNSFIKLDNAIVEIIPLIEDGSLDSDRVKAVFYSLYFGKEDLNSLDYKGFTDCFVRYEVRTHTTDDTATEVTYTVVIPLSLPEIYENLSIFIGREITNEEKANASEIYNRALYGDIPTDGDGFNNWLNTITADSTNTPFIGGDFVSPLETSWHSVVTSEFGYRKDPFTGETAGHSGIDLAMPKGTPITVSNGGTVKFVRYSTTGYGYHLAIDHGGGIITLYAHCSKILVCEGQTVIQGEIIAEVGSTGRSTGNHLHYEVIVSGEKVNPRLYLP